MTAYISPEEAAVQQRRESRKLTLVGAVLAGAGAVGIVLSVILNVVWLGVLGEPISALSWIALITGAVCFWLGYTKIKATRQIGGQIGGGGGA